MIKRLLATVMLGGLVSTASATQNYLPMGSNLTWGSTSHHQYLMSHKNNTAVGASILGWRTGGFGMGLIGPLSLGVDVGPLGKAVEISGDLTQLINEFDNLSGGGDGSNIDLSAVTDTFNFADTALTTLGTSIDLNVKIGAEIPLFPMVITHKKFGSILIDFNDVASIRAQVLDSPLDSNPLIDPLQGLDSKYSTNSSLYLKVANVFESTVGYSREVFRNDRGILYAGLKTNIYSVLLNKSLLPLLDMGTAADDALSQAQETAGAQNAFGLDVSALFMVRKTW